MKQPRFALLALTACARTAAQWRGRRWLRTLCLPFALLFALLTVSEAAVADEMRRLEKTFPAFLQQVAEQARREGVREGTVQTALLQATFLPNVVALDRKQPEGKFTFDQYYARVINAQRVRDAKRFYREHRALLERTAARYGVQPRFIVALWGIESNFGRNMGGTPVVSALATLAHEGRRRKFFMNELLKALHILDGGHISARAMVGSWAGAMGQSQFMPSSWHTFAVDADGDGHKDIWRTQADVFASIAHYLSKSGWDDRWTWGREVRVPAGFDRSLAALSITKPLTEWQRLGVRRMDGSALPAAPLDASLVFPGEGARAFLAYPNYKVIMKWNRSTYFATAVGLLANQID